MSWDETAVLIGVYGTKDFFTTVNGKIVVHPDGSNGWIDDPTESIPMWCRKCRWRRWQVY